MLSYKPDYCCIYSNQACLLFPTDIQIYSYLESRILPPRPGSTRDSNTVVLSLYLSFQSLEGVLLVSQVSIHVCLASPCFQNIASTVVIHNIILSIPSFCCCSIGSLKYFSSFWVKLALTLPYSIAILSCK